MKVVVEQVQGSSVIYEIKELTADTGILLITDDVGMVWGMKAFRKYHPEVDFRNSTRIIVRKEEKNE